MSPHSPSRVAFVAVIVAMISLAAGCASRNGAPTDIGDGTSTDSGNGADADEDATDIDTGISIDADEDAATDGGSGGSTDADEDAAIEDALRPTLLDQVASITARTCAVAECHDSITKQHGMDLSTAPSVYASWVNQKGIDHCQNKLLVRVTPFRPEASYVIAKITATMKMCDLWDPMPPPPREMLSMAEIETIRAWILAGARSQSTAGTMARAAEHAIP